MDKDAFMLMDDQAGTAVTVLQVLVDKERGENDATPMALDDLEANVKDSALTCLLEFFNFDVTRIDDKLPPKKERTNMVQKETDKKMDSRAIKAVTKK